MTKTRATWDWVCYCVVAAFAIVGAISVAAFVVLVGG